jgi:hypothetical protein
MTTTTIPPAQPLLFNKNLGQPLRPMSDLPPYTNADGEPVVPLTQEQKYVFDTWGWLLIPSVLNDADIEEMRAFCYCLKRDPESIPEPHRRTYGGPLERLTDHPVVVGFAREFLASPYLANEECYGFRMEMSFLALRTSTDEEPNLFNAHNGNGMFRMPGDSHSYNCIPGKANAGLTRVVWELNPVEKGDGGTLFITGSHKAAYTGPESAYHPESPLWETYSCPAGSVIIFTESTTHSGQTWMNPDIDRVAIFNAYNNVNTRWSRSRPHPDHIAAMPPKRQTLFRDVYASGNLTGGEPYANLQ